ncbi:MAG: DUF4833 domain-containing protein [Bacteroidales bacterium]|jgi:predicted DNA binding protein|nr:DUF4833 domain-containing protein [Bacteroidales bacterium]
MKRFAYIIIWLLAPISVLLGSTNIPVSDIDNNRFLFKIERSRDSNEIIYEVNLDENGKLIKSNPINVYWLKNTDHKNIEPLTFIQQKYAYGIKLLDSENLVENEWRFQFVSYSKRTFILKQIDNSTFKVFTKIKNREVSLNSIFIRFENNSFWFPSISAVELQGRITNSDKWLAEIVIP